MDDVRLVVFDLDGTLRRSRTPLRSAPRGDSDWELLPNVRERIAALRAARPDLRFGIATNQDQVARGRIAYEVALRLAGDAARAAGLGDAAIEVCPHGQRSACRCHKPRPGMIERLAAREAVALRNVLVVGNALTDAAAAHAAGARFVPAATFFRRRPGSVLDAALALLQALGLLARERGVHGAGDRRWQVTERKRERPEDEPRDAFDKAGKAEKDTVDDADAGDEVREEAKEKLRPKR